MDQHPWPSPVQLAQQQARRLRINALTRRPVPTWYCEEHAAMHDGGTECPGPALDRLLARSVSVRAAVAFGLWPATR